MIIMENPIKMDDLEVPLFQKKKHHIYIITYVCQKGLETPTIHTGWGPQI